MTHPFTQHHEKDHPALPLIEPLSATHLIGTCRDAASAPAPFQHVGNLAHIVADHISNPESGAALNTSIRIRRDELAKHVFLSLEKVAAQHVVLTRPFPEISADARPILATNALKKIEKRLMVASRLNGFTNPPEPAGTTQREAETLLEQGYNHDDWRYFAAVVDLHERNGGANFTGGIGQRTLDVARAEATARASLFEPHHLELTNLLGMNDELPVTLARVHLGQALYSHASDKNLETVRRHLKRAWQAKDGSGSDYADTSKLAVKIAKKRRPVEQAQPGGATPITPDLEVSPKFWSAALARAEKSSEADESVRRHLLAVLCSAASTHQERTAARFMLHGLPFYPTRGATLAAAPFHGFPPAAATSMPDGSL